MTRPTKPAWYNKKIMDPTEKSNQATSLHPMVVMQPGERIVCELKRHPIGILIVYFGAFMAVAVTAAFLYFIMPSLRDSYGSGQATTMVLLGGGILLAGMLLMLLVTTIIYWQNQWVVTTDSITQISQNGLFGRQVSQLSLENLEDVTVTQNGILPHLFNLYCPNPNQCAREILDTHEKFLEDRRNIQYAGSANPAYQQQAAQS
jgi:hypothetical protein